MMSNSVSSFSGDLFPPSSPERKRQKINNNGRDNKSLKSSTIMSKPDPLPRPNSKLLSKGIIYHTKDEYINGKTLEINYPSKYWMRSTPIQVINSDSPIELYKSLNINEIKINNSIGWGYGGYVNNFSFSDDGELLACASTVGCCFICDSIDWNIISMIRDENEKDIEEIYCVKFSNDCTKIITCGKLKSRSIWSEEDNDNFCIPGYIKFYDILSGKLLLKIKGHQEEILAMKHVSFKGDNYLLTCGQDGRIIKWSINDDYSSYSSVYIDDLTTHYVCSLAILPNCGNKFFIAGCDEGLKLYDFERNLLVESFPDLYSSFCDVVKIVNLPTIPLEDNETLLVTRGVELLNQTTGKPIKSNKCYLLKLIAPNDKSQNFTLEQIRIFQHPEYFANTWLMNLCVTSRYLLAPTTTGKIFIWSLLTGQLVSIIQAHTSAIRDIIFHPYNPQFVTCGDDSTIQIFIQYQSDEEDDEDDYDSSDISEEEEEEEKDNKSAIPQQILNIPSSISFKKPKNTKNNTQLLSTLDKIEEVSENLSDDSSLGD